MLCWSWAMYFSTAPSSEKYQGSMNLASKTAPVPATMPSRVAAIQGLPSASPDAGHLRRFGRYCARTSYG